MWVPKQAVSRVTDLRVSAEAHDSRVMDLCEGAEAHEFTRLYVCVFYAFGNMALALPLSRGVCTRARRVAPAGLVVANGTLHRCVESSAEGKTKLQVSISIMYRK